MGRRVGKKGSMWEEKNVRGEKTSRGTPVLQDAFTKLKKMSNEKGRENMGGMWEIYDQSMSAVLLLLGRTKDMRDPFAGALRFAASLS